MSRVIAPPLFLLISSIFCAVLCPNLPLTLHLPGWHNNRPLILSLPLAHSVLYLRGSTHLHASLWPLQSPPPPPVLPENLPCVQAGGAIQRVLALGKGHWGASNLSPRDPRPIGEGPDQVSSITTCSAQVGRVSTSPVGP